MMVRGGPGTNSPGQFTCNSVSLRILMLRAYHVKRYEISGPAWIDTAGFDISAKIPQGTTNEQFDTMLRNLLAERFGLEVHRETKELPIYALIVAKGGHKMKAADESAQATRPDPSAIRNFKSTDGFPISPAAMGVAGAFPFVMAGKARIDASRSSMDSLARTLSDTLGRPVIDMTNLPGNYAFSLYYTPDSVTAPDTEAPVSLFAAIQEQLGLKLDARKGPVELLVIDRAEKTPSGN